MGARHVVELIRKWLVLLLVFGAAGAGAGAALYRLQTPQYAATTTLLFSLQSDQSLSTMAEGSAYVQSMIPTYAEVLDSPLVLDPVVQAVAPGLTAKELSHKVTVVRKIDSVVVDVRVVSDRPQEAAALANAIADEMARATNTLAPQGTKQIGRIAVTQVSPAQAPNEPFAPNLLRHLVLGLLGGLLVAGSGLLLLDFIRSSPVSTRSAVARVTRVPVLGLVPVGPKDRYAQLPVERDPLSPRAEGYRFLQSGLLRVTPEGHCCVAVTSSEPGEGRTSTAANLALAVALSDPKRRVLVVDADLRSGALAGLLGVDGEVGLSQVLLGYLPLDQALASWTPDRAGQVTLTVLPAGRTEGEPADLLASLSMSRLVEQLRSSFDIVIFDTPSLRRTTDGATLAAQLDGALMVVDTRRARHRQLTLAMSRMRLAGVRTLGVVLNRVPESDAHGKARRPRPHLPHPPTASTSPATSAATSPALPPSVLPSVLPSRKPPRRPTKQPKPAPQQAAKKTAAAEPVPKKATTGQPVAATARPAEPVPATAQPDQQVAATTQPPPVAARTRAPEPATAKAYPPTSEPAAAPPPDVLDAVISEGIAAARERPRRRDSNGRNGGGGSLHRLSSLLTPGAPTPRHDRVQPVPLRRYPLDRDGVAASVSPAPLAAPPSDGPAPTSDRPAPPPDGPAPSPGSPGPSAARTPWAAPDPAVVAETPGPEEGPDREQGPARTEAPGRAAAPDRAE